MIKQFKEHTLSRKLYFSLTLLFAITLLRAQEIEGPNGEDPETSPNCSTGYTYVLVNSFPDVNTLWTWDADGGRVVSGQGSRTVSVIWDQPATNAGPRLSVSYNNEVIGAVHLDVTITQVSAPTISNEVICPGGSVTLSIGQSANWYTSATGGTAYVANSWTVSPTTTTDYWVSKGAGECESARTKVTVTVSSLTAGTITGGDDIYPGQQPDQITGTVGTYSHGTARYRWEKSTTSDTTGFSPISDLDGGNGQNYQPDNIDVDTWYRRRLVTDCGTGFYSNVEKVEVDETVPGMTGSETVNCTGTYTYTLQNPTVTTGWTWVADGGTIQSGQGSTSVNVTWDDIASGNGPQLSVSLNGSIMGAIQKTITPTQLTAPTGISGATICPGESVTLNAGQVANWYDSPGDNSAVVASTYTVSPSASGTHTYYVSYGTAECESARTAVSVTVSSVNAGFLNGVDQIYPGQIPATIVGSVGTYSPGGPVYGWEKSTTSDTVGFGSITGAAGKDLTFSSGVTQDTWYRRKLVTACAVTQYTTAVKVDVDESVPTLSGDTNVNCYDSYTYSLTGASQSSGWTWNPDGGRVVSGQGTTSVSVIWDQPISVNGPEISVSQNGSIMGAIQQSVTISSSHSGGTAMGEQLDVCYGANASALNVTGSLSSGAAFQWQVRSLTNTGAIWTNIDGATSASYNPGKVYQDREYRRETTRCNTTTYSSAVSITVLDQNHAGEILGEQTIYSDEQALMLTSVSAPSTEDVVNVKWQYSTTGADTGFSDVLDGSSQPVTTMTFTPPATLTQDTWYRRLLVNSCADLPTNSLKITVLPAPDPGSITGGGTINYDTRPANITGTNPNLTEALFQWEYSYDQAHWTPLADQTGLSYHPPYLHRNTHFRRAMYYQGLRRYTNEVSFTVNGVSGDQKPKDLSAVTTVTAASPMDVSTASELNFVRTYTVQIPGQTDYSTVKSNANNDEVIMSTSYLDGLGRPLQSISRGASPLQKDLVSVTDLDEFGRGTRSFMPYVSTSTDGKFNTNAATQQGSFNSGQFSGESHFYGQSVIENSPVNRPLHQSAPGKSWAGNGLGNAMHYLTNTSSEGIRYWTVDNTGAADPSTTSVYTTGELSKTRSEDENGNPINEFTDKEGRVILKQVAAQATPAAGHSDWLNTYYLYDDYGNLRYVLPPRAVELLEANSWNWASAGISALTFEYTYDGRNRMITKKVPGAGTVQMIYDPLDRLVMTQDANQAAIDQWTFTKYDVLNRPVLTGFITDANRSADSLRSIGANWLRVMHVTKEELSTAGVLEGATITTSNRDTDIDTYRTKTTGYIEFLPGFETPNGDDFETETSLALSYEYTYYEGYHDATFPLLSTYDPDDFQINTVNYYDNYDFTDKSWSTDFQDFYTAGGSYNALTPTMSDQVEGMATGSKVRILGSDDFLTTVMFYDDRGRVIQTQGENHLGGEDISTTQYDFAGRVLHTYTVHNNPEASANSTTRILKQFEYDHTGRLLSIKEKLNNTGSLKTLVTHTYDELGQLEIKKLGNPTDALETLEYDYNIRGWLTGINGDELDDADNGTDMTNHYFAMGLSYDKGFTNRQYNGNIAGVKWKSQSSDQIKAYGFDYDPVNRLSTADYTQGSGWTQTVADFSTGYDYDANGNIQKLMRMGTIAGTITRIDSLSYNYGSGFTNAAAGNQLIAVKDSEGDRGQGDFADGNTSGDDYQYDLNGNMKDDLNKGISNITYNHLNLPVTVTFNGGKSITYTYDAAGIKLSKAANDNGTITTTDYAGGFIYENDALQHFAHEEGRVRAKGSELVYDYFIKDHLGNTRMTLTEARDSVVYEATMETALASFEEEVFLNIPATRSTDYAFEGTQSAKLGPESVGPAKMLLVSPGDTVDLSVYARYASSFTSTQAGNSTNLGLALAGLFGATGSGASVYEQGTYNTLNTNAGSFLASVGSGTSNVPKAYLNYVFFDQDFNLVQSASGYQQVGSGAEDTFDLITANGLVMSKAGYLYVYLSNEGRTSDGGTVYFDVLRINHKKGAILQEDHYYPFGLSINALSSSAPLSKPNHFKYNGKETQADFDLNWIDYGSRMFDPQIARWHVIDPQVDRFFDYTPYNYTLNNPINLIDPDGECPTCPGEGETGDTHSYNGIGYTLGEDGRWTNGFGFTHQELTDLANNVSQTVSGDGLLGEWEGSTLTLSVALMNTPAGKLKGSASTNGTIKIFLEKGIDGKWAGFKIAGFAAKQGVQLKDGELRAFSIGEFDLLGLNYSRDLDPGSGKVKDKFSIAIKWGYKNISLTYRQQITNGDIPHVKGEAGFYSASYMAQRSMAARSYQASRSSSRVIERNSVIDRTSASMEHIMKSLPPLKQYVRDQQVRHQQDATRHYVQRKSN